MARKPVVDRDTVLHMLREGQTTQSVADAFGVTRQAVDIHRREFIAQGLLADQRAPRSRHSAPPSATQVPLAQVPQAAPAAQPEPQTSPTASHRELAALPLDQIIDLAIDAFAALKKLPEAEAERDRYRQEYESARAEIDRLREAESRRSDQEQRWLHAQQ